MKKFLSISLAIMLVLGIAGQGFSEAIYSRGADAKLQTVVVSASASPTLSTTCVAGNNVLGWRFSDSSAGNTALFDVAAAQSSTGSTTLAPSTSNVFDEGDVIAGGEVIVFFPIPKTLTNGLVTKNSATTGKLTVYFE